MNNQHGKYFLLYLKTGGGHLAPAKSISNYLIKKYPDSVSPILVDGFEEANKFVRYFIEEGYRKLQAKAKWYYEFLYAVNKFDLFARFNCQIVSIYSKKYLKKLILKEKPDKILIFHFFLIQPVYEILRNEKLKCKVYTIVTDPFTAHPMWFINKNQNFIVFSEKLKEKMKRKINEEKINIFPFIVDEKFSNPFKVDEIKKYKLKMNIPFDKKIILIIGGGDGIPNGEKILNKLLKTELNALIIIVCGNNKILFKYSKTLEQKFGSHRIRALGYVDTVYEIINISDVVLTKCGASTIYEILILKKIPIVNDFIWEQEKGNIDFIKEFDLGIYQPEIKKIPNILNELINDEEKILFYKKNIEKLHLISGTSMVSEFIYNS